ncbi:MAG: hypothetical protein AB1413_02880 [Thermodesulfobacteriota bacterium]
MGHLSRCLTLAGAFAEAGISSRFLINAPSSLLARVAGAGHQVTPSAVPVGIKDDPASWNAEDCSLLILDSKALTPSFVETCRAFAPVLCFDDEAPRDFPCDVLINNHPWARADDYGQQSGRKLLLGSAFNTVHPDFFVSREQLHGLLITLGGEDPHNHTGWLIEQLAGNIGELSTEIVVGPAHPAPEMVQLACKRWLPHAEVHIGPSSLVPFAWRSHIAISAAGTTCYELAAAGVAMAVLAVEDHQERLAASMVAGGAALSFGSHGTLDAGRVRNVFADLVQPAISAELAAAGRRMFPAPGITAIVDELKPLIQTTGRCA